MLKPMGYFLTLFKHACSGVICEHLCIDALDSRGENTSGNSHRICPEMQINVFELYSLVSVIPDAFYSGSFSCGVWCLSACFYLSVSCN